MGHLHGSMHGSTEHAQEKTLQQQGAAQAMLLRQGQRVPTYPRRIVPVPVGRPKLGFRGARVGWYHKLLVRMPRVSVSCKL